MEVAVEVEPAEAVLGDDVLVAVGQKLGQQRRVLHVLGVQVVLVQEARQVLVGVEHVAVLVLPEQGAGLEGVEHLEAFLRVEQARAEHGHLTFQHFREVRDVHAAIGFHRHQVVRVVQAVGTLVGPDGMFEVRERHLDEARQVRQRQCALAAGEVLLVNFVAVVAGCGAQTVQDGAALGVGNVARRQPLVLAQSGVDAAEAVQQFLRDGNFLVVGLRQDVLEVDQEPAEVVQGHHGHAVAHQGVVGVVPLRTLGVHPNAALRDEVGDFGEHGGHQLLDEVHLVDEDVGLAQERAVAANFAALEVDFLACFVVVIDCVLGVLQNGVVRLDPVGDVGVDERVVLEVVFEFLGVVRLQELQELQEVDDLVVAPVADVRPRVVRLNFFPLEAILEHAVRVVAVEGGRVQELENHAFDELGVRVHQGFPVLEDVAPVALVVQNLRPGFFVTQVDGEAVPRTAGVAVAAAELQRQVLGAQALEVEVVVLSSLGLQEGQVELLGPPLHELGLLEEDLVVGPVDVGHEVGPLDGVVLVENAAPHDVEHRVGEVADVAAAVGRELQSVAGGHQFDEPLRAFFDVFKQRRLERIGCLQVLLQLHHAADRLAQIRGHDPVLGGAGRQFEVRLDEVGAAFRFDVGFCDHGSAGLEGRKLFGGQEHLGGVQADGPHHVRLQRLAGLGLVGDDGAQRVQAEVALFEFALLVGVHQVAAAALEAFRHAVGQDVLDAVEHAHLHGGRCGRRQFCVADEAVFLAGRPLVLEGESEVVVDFFEQDLVAVGVLVQVALEAVDPFVLV